MVLLLVLGGSTAAWYFYSRPQSGPPTIAVLPFKNLTGDPAQDDMGEGVAEEIGTLLSTFPTFQVVSRSTSFPYKDKPIQQMAQELGVRYAVDGSVQKSADKVRVTAHLIDAATGNDLWSDGYSEEGEDLVALEGAVANKVYGSLAGFGGRLREEEDRNAWSMNAPSLEEYDYYLRATTLWFRFNKADNTRARQVLENGLTKFPDSALLRLKIVSTYIIAINRGWGDAADDLDRACKLTKEIAAIENKSRLERWTGHWQMATLAQWCEGDFERSVSEAEAAVEMVPYDAMSRSDLAGLLTNAGKTDEAIAWAREAMRLDPKGPEWYRWNLAWALYHGGHAQDALAEFHKLTKTWAPNLAAVYVRAGQVDAARTLIGEFIKSNPGFTIRDEAYWPSNKHPQLKEPLQQAYVSDLRQAGLSEK
jgi:TolB-like protein